MNKVMLILEFCLAIVLIVTILLQESKADALSGLIQGQKTESFYSKNKGKTKKSILEKVTWITTALFMVNTLLMNIL